MKRLSLYFFLALVFISGGVAILRLQYSSRIRQSSLSPNGEWNAKLVESNGFPFFNQKIITLIIEDRQKRMIYESDLVGIETNDTSDDSYLMKWIEYNRLAIDGRDRSSSGWSIAIESGKVIEIKKWECPECH